MKKKLRSEGDSLGKGAQSISLLNFNDPGWMRWINEKSSANIFHHPAWSELLSLCYGYRSFVLAVQDSRGEVSAGIPLMEIKSPLNKKRWVALPFTDHCSPLSDSPNAYQDLLDAMSSQRLQAGLSKVEVRWELPPIPSAHCSTHHVLHQLGLEADPSRVYSRFHATHRRNIKTAEKSGLRIEQGNTEEYLRAFYRLHLITRQRQGMPTQPWWFFQLLGKLLLERDLGFVVLAYKEDACIAASVFLKWQKTLMYKYGASTPDSLQYRPNNLVMWTAIRWGCENGFAVFDMGRTDNENTGLRQYKSNWGAQEVPLIYTNLSQQPEHEGSGQLMQLVQNVIRRSPVWFSQLTGQLFYRFFG